MKDIFIKLIIIGFVFVFFICMYVIINDFFQYNESKEIILELKEEVIENNVETGKKFFDWEKLKQINIDIVGWIEIENTNINYPILKDNNLYYLNHSHDKKYNKNGAIFTTNTYPFQEQETIIYGHNMKNGSMFSDLGKYLKKDYFDSHNKIKIYTPNGDFEGIIFSAYSIGIDEENNNIKSLDFIERIEYYKKASAYKIENIDNIAKIIKLSTCSYINAKTTPTDQRYYIVAYIFQIL